MTAKKTQKKKSTPASATTSRRPTSKPSRTPRTTRTTTPSRPKQKKPSTSSAAAPASSPRRAAAALVTIGVTPPELAPDTPAHALNQQLASRATRPAPAELAVLPWLAQDRAYRAGYHLLTHGLRKHAGHPELELCNVPGALLAAAQRVLKDLADDVLQERSFAHGEVMMLSATPLAVVGFLRVDPGEGGTTHDVDVLRVVLLR
jgi:hypothetical protein